MKKFTFLVSFLFIATVAFSQDVLMQNGTVTQCSGTFYDSGGPGGNYSSDENFTLTICPDIPGNQIQLDFTAFSTQLNNDTITFYDGDDTTANAFGTYSGGSVASSPGVVIATPNNTTGCITIVFTSDPSATTTGWEATISCYEPCQTITSQLDSSTPAPNGDGYIRVCTDEDITLNGSGIFSVDGTGATYEWDLGDGNTVSGQTATFSYPTPGVYIVNLNITDTNTDPAPGTGCTNTNLINQVIQVSTEPDFTATQATQNILCYGETTTIDGVVMATEFINDCTPPVSGTTFLPDGNGATYSTCVTVDCYDSSQTLTDINQIIGICVNMEHSFLGDLDINIISPTGQVAVLKEYPGGGGTYLGGANDDNTNTPGVGADYCFSTAGTVTLENGPTIIAGTPPSNSIAPGTYLPEGTLNTLLGSPLNGDWCIQIIDNLGIDNGFIFSWSIEFDPNLQPPELSFTPVTVTEGWDADPTITNTTGNTITVAPPSAGQYCYTYRATDDFGCEYTEQVCIDVLPELVTDPPNDLFLCNPGTPPYIFDLTQNDAVINASATNPGDQIITYFETQMDADNNTNPIPNPDMYSSSAIIGTPQTIYVRIEYLSSGCFETDTFTLNITTQPTINPAIDMVACDDVSNDGVATFDLTTQDAIILGTQPAADYTVTYFASLADAAANVNALVSPYNNIANPQPIFVRVELTADALCFNVTTNPAGEFNLIVNPSPEILSLTSNTDICSGDDAVFTITGTATHVVDYNINGGGTLQTTLDASGQSVITVPAVTADQTITLESVANPTTTCTAPLTNTETITVNTNPTVVLTSNTSICSGNDAVFTITGDAGNTVDYNINGSGTQQVLIDGTGVAIVTVTGATVDQTITLETVTNPTTTCSSVLTDTNTVTISANPVITSLTTNTDICSGNDAIFTINGTPDDSIEYTINGGATQQIIVDAAGEAIVTITAATIDQTITLETVTNPVSTCSSVLTDTATVTVLPNPTVTLTSNMAVCTGEDAVFTITGTATHIVDYNINGGATVQTTLDAAGESVITITAPAVDQTLTLESVTNPTTTCNSPLTASNTVVINPLPTLITPTPLEVCDDGTPDGFTAIDLTIKNNEITGSNPAYSVTYYLNQADADAQTNPLPNTYTNISNPQTIVAGVLNTNTSCYNTITLDLVVEQAPVIFTPTALEYCDPDSDGFGVFTLTDADAQITGGAPGLTVT
ncbi:PKD domain-containing protein, partial [Lacinutrix chionoecetis]